MTEEPPYQSYGSPQEVPVGDQAAMEGLTLQIERLIGDLVDTECDEHLSSPHDCLGNCHSKTVAHFVLDTIPEYQARTMLLHTIKMLGVFHLVTTLGDDGNE